MNEAEQFDDGSVFRAAEVDLTSNAEKEQPWSAQRFDKELDREEKEYFSSMATAAKAGDRAGDLQGTVAGSAYDEAVAEERTALAAAEVAKSARLKLIEAVPVEHSGVAESIRLRRGLMMADSVHNPENKKTESK